MKTCTFFGHRDIIFNRSIIIKRLNDCLISLINRGVDRFIIGSHGDFDSLALSECKKLRKIYPNIKIEVSITSLSKMKKNKDNFCDLDVYLSVDTFYYPIEDVHYKRIITVNNQFMVNDSDIVVCYVRSNATRSGAKTSMNYAIKQGKEVINLYQEQDYDNIKAILADSMFLNNSDK